jgi:predicted nucleic acid-binding protein
MPNAFVDSNVLIYAANESLPISRNTNIAREVLRQRDLWISIQVLNEFTVYARKKLKLSPEEWRLWLDRLLLFSITTLTTETFLAALSIHARYQLSHWDSLIIASARETDCSIVYSEDMNHEQNYDGVQVINPFL